MKSSAVIATLLALGYFLIFMYAGVNEKYSIEQVVLCGLMLATMLICLSNVEK